MAKLELKKKHNPDLPSILMIPGGPGLSPVSFFKMEEYLGSLNVYYFYPSGTHGDNQTGNPSYSRLLSELKREVIHLKDIYLCGHSFGGIQAIDLTLQDDLSVKGLICISTPVRRETFNVSRDNFSENKSDENKKLDELMDSHPSDDLYREWFASYARLYFSKTNITEGKKMLLEDSVSVKNFVGAITEAGNKEELLTQLKSKPMKKIFITGSDDGLLPPETLELDAKLGGFDFHIIKEAGHFVPFEKPKETSNIIKRFILNKEK